MNVEVDIPPSSQAMALQTANATRERSEQRMQQAMLSITMAALTEMFTAGSAQALKDHNISTTT